MNQPAITNLPNNLRVRPATAEDAPAIHALLRPFVMQRLLLARTESELIELTRHGFVAEQSDSATQTELVGFSAIEVFSTKLAELVCLAVRSDYQKTGVGRQLVRLCIERARELNVMELLAISSSEDFLKSCGFDYALPDQKKALFCQLRPRPTE